MLSKIARGILIIILTLAVLLGAVMAIQRYMLEAQSKTVEVCVDLNDLKKIAAFEKKPLTPILKEIRKLGISSIGVFEETLPDAGAMGEIIYASGSGIIRSQGDNDRFTALISRNKIKPDRTYLCIAEDQPRKRIYFAFKNLLGKDKVKFLSANIIEVDETEGELREAGLGISEVQKKYLIALGFKIIPRTANDVRYHLGNIGGKILSLKGAEVIVFDKEEILGYPDSLRALASALQKNNIRYGYIEIVKQDGDVSLKKLMGRNVLRVHSIPEDELKKITRGEAVKRFTRAAAERRVNLLYIRPFLPPQIDASPAAFNLVYFKEVMGSLSNAGFVIGAANEEYLAPPAGWQILLLGTGVIISFLFLWELFFPVSHPTMYGVLIGSLCGMALVGTLGYGLLLQKLLAFIAAVTFPSYAVISNFKKQSAISQNILAPMLMVLNIIGELFIGVFLLIGLLADYRFMSGVEVFAGIKPALIIPIMLVALYFILELSQGKLKERLLQFLNIEVKLMVVISGLLVLGLLAVFVARSGNFSLPVPGIEKYFRNMLEAVLMVRPRTKEFLVGYPFLFLAVFFLLRREYKWLWLLAAIGTIAPISVFNSFCHAHTPLIISFIRSLNGLVIGIIIGSLVWWTAKYSVE
ncbi:MAG: DUF5693 family protein [Candidatus Margulisbacteria bacterium]|nr:DUF5693 family protein [Candidatus Margulisiibacteriota bacterium]